MNLNPSPARRPRPSYRRFGAPLLAAAMLLGLTWPAAGAAQASSVDAFSAYQPQTTCRKTPLPGTVYLLHWLQRHYPHPGISSMIAPAAPGGDRAQGRPGAGLGHRRDRALAEARATAFLKRCSPPTAPAATRALARRMGIMYVIWDDHIYGAYTDPAFLKRDYLASGCKTAAKCSPTLQHRDHIHISLSWAGASAQTSFYRDRRVPSMPVLYPGTRRLDPVQTAVVKVPVPADGSTVRTPFKVTRGTTYRIVAGGLYRFGAGSHIGDAACSWQGGGWAPSSTGLLVNGHSPFTDSCTDGHTHVASYTAHRTGVLHLRVGDPDPAHNTGTLTFAIVRPDISAGVAAAHPAVAGPAPTRRTARVGRPASWSRRPSR